MCDEEILINSTRERLTPASDHRSNRPPYPRIGGHPRTASPRALKPTHTQAHTRLDRNLSKTANIDSVYIYTVDIEQNWTNPKMPRITRESGRGGASRLAHNAQAGVGLGRQIVVDKPRNEPYNEGGKLGRPNHYHWRLTVSKYYFKQELNKKLWNDLNTELQVEDLYSKTIEFLFVDNKNEVLIDFWVRQNLWGEYEILNRNHPTGTVNSRRELFQYIKTVADFVCHDKFVLYEDGDSRVLLPLGVAAQEEGFTK